MRGEEYEDITRITSTYVENTLFLDMTEFGSQDHLHLRGEHAQCVHDIVYYLGSPPLTWRTLMRGEEYEDITRITSTYVENTTSQ